MRDSAGHTIIAKIFLLLTIVSLTVAAGPNHPDPVSNPDVTGNWKIEPTTFAIRSLATPNTFPRPQLPTNFSAFLITLNTNLTFTTANLPTKELSPKEFIWPTNVPSAGKWRVNTQYFVSPIDHGLATNYSLDLWFTSPRFISWTPSLFWHTNKTLRTPHFTLGPYRDQTGTYEWTVAMTRQN